MAQHTKISGNFCVLGNFLDSFFSLAQLIFNTKLLEFLCNFPIFILVCVTSLCFFSFLIPLFSESMVILLPVPSLSIYSSLNLPSSLNSLIQPSHQDILSPNLNMHTFCPCLVRPEYHSIFGAASLTNSSSSQSSASLDCQSHP